MDKNKIGTSKLLPLTILDVKDDLDERLERCYTTVINSTNGLSDREVNDVLQAYVGRGTGQHDETMFGLFCGILVDPKLAPRFYRDLTLVTRDGLNKVMTITNQMIYEKWIKLLDGPRTQLVWFAKELVKNSMNGAESVMHSLIRQIAGGDVSQKNMWLAESILDIFTENRGWLEKHPPILAIALYTFLRIIVDHGAPTFASLQQREVEFCVSLMREKWMDSMAIGRDLARLLQNIARIPQIEQLWRDILNNPTVLHSSFTGIQQLMSIRSSKRYFVSRLTPDMENKLVFLTSKVKFGQHKRYQDWFQRQYLSTPESQSLRCDLIRYICAVIHPSNEVLCSDIIPRWAVIGWLLQTCTSNVAASNAKLSLFFDWMFFEPEKESIMNIEPCILVMYYSMRPHPAITATLLDFMCRIIKNFFPPLTEQIRQGFYTSLRTIISKRVLQSLSPLFDNPKLDRELRSMIREHFIEFCNPDLVKEEAAGGLNNKDPMMDMDGPTNHMMLDDSNSFSEAHFSSSDEDDGPIGKVEELHDDIKFEPIKLPPRFHPVDISEQLDQLDGDIKDLVAELQRENDNETQCELIDRLMQVVIQESPRNDDIVTPLATCLCQVLIQQFNNTLFPQDINEESIMESIEMPLFMIFRNICQTVEEDPDRQPLFILLEEMYLQQTRIGYHFLYFLKANKSSGEEKFAPYRDFCKNLESKDLRSCLMLDLQLCQEDDVRLFTYLISDIYTQFPNIAIGNSELLLLIVSCIDSTQLQDLVCEILQGHMVMFRKDSFLSVLNASMDWETIEQYFLWQLIAAHNIPVDYIMPILPKLEFVSHAEALTSILIQLKQEVPTCELLRPLLCRECRKSDLFVVSILKHWAQECEDKLATLLHSQITQSNNGTPSRKRHRHQQPTSGKAPKDKEGPTMDQILAHLDHMRRTCRNISFLTNESIQDALRHVQATCSETQKAKYGDLLALAEDYEELSRSTRVLRQVPSRRASAAASVINSIPGSNRSKKSHDKDDSETSEESSEEDEIIRPPKSKKAKRPTVYDDD